MSTPETRSEKDSFSLRDYTIEALAIRDEILRIEDSALRDSLVEHVTKMQGMLHPVMEEYLERHPDADQRIELETDLEESPLFWER